MDEYGQLLSQADTIGYPPELLKQMIQILGQIAQQQQVMIQILSAPKQTKVARGPDGKVAGAVHQTVMPPQDQGNMQ